MTVYFLCEGVREGVSEGCTGLEVGCRRARRVGLLVYELNNESVQFNDSCVDRADGT